MAGSVSRPIAIRDRIGYNDGVMTSPLKTFRKTQQPPLSQNALAKLLDVSRETVARWELGKRKIGGGLLSKVSEQTGIPKNELRPDLAKLMDEAV